MIITIVIQSLALVALAIYALVLNVKLWDRKLEVEGLNRWVEELEAAAEPKPICLCGHGINNHKKKSGGCEHIVKYFDAWPGWLNAQRAQYCDCNSYTGPEPLPTYYHPLELESRNV